MTLYDDLSGMSEQNMQDHARNLRYQASSSMYGNHVILRGIVEEFKGREDVVEVYNEAKRLLEVANTKQLELHDYYEKVHDLIGSVYS